jgi:hypothetical protein
METFFCPFLVQNWSGHREGAPSLPGLPWLLEFDRRLSFEGGGGCVLGHDCTGVIILTIKWLFDEYLY